MRERVTLLRIVAGASQLMRGIARNFVIGQRAPLGGPGTGARKRSLYWHCSPDASLLSGASTQGLPSNWFNVSSDINTFIEGQL